MKFVLFSPLWVYITNQLRWTYSHSSSGNQVAGFVIADGRFTLKSNYCTQDGFCFMVKRFIRYVHYTRAK